MFLSDENRHGSLLPDDDRNAGGQVQRQLVGVVEAKVVTKVSGTGLNGSSVPDEAEVSAELSDEFIRQERAHVRDVLLSEVLVTDAVEVEPYTVDVAEVGQVDTFLGRQVAGDDDAVPFPVRFAIRVTCFRVEPGQVIEDAERDERRFRKTLAHQIALHLVVVADDEVRSSDEPGLFEIDAHPFHERQFARVFVAHGLEVVDQERDEDASFAKRANESRKQRAVRAGRELHQNPVPCT